MNLISEDYLMHYGVKGMKWGVRHDPERIGSGRMSARKQYKKAKKDALLRYVKRADQLEKSGKGNDLDANMRIASQYDAERKQAKQNYQNAKKENPLLTDQQKQMAKKMAIGAAVVAGVGLATYGGVKLSKIRSGNKAAIAKYLDNNPDIANSVLKGGKPYKPIAERVPNIYDPTRLKGGSTLSRGKITNSIKGPTLHTTRSTVNAWYPTWSERGGVTKMLERDAIGANGRGRIMTKEQQKYYNKLYKDYIRLYKNNK